MEAVAIFQYKCVAPSVILPLYDSGECGGTKVTKLDACRQDAGGVAIGPPSLRQFSNPLRVSSACECLALGARDGL